MNRGKIRAIDLLPVINFINILLQKHIARFNKVMNSDDEELKKKVLADEVSINAGYEKVIIKEVRCHLVSDFLMDRKLVIKYIDY